jgi:7,8-dihydropterin-6-yl-methyl-4-(beta-D-ribofuranosyl)aminobenzene 5'-phosphate synthase
MRRRTVLGLGSAALATLASRAAARPLTIPSIDRLTLQVVVDNAVFGPFLPDISRPGLNLQRASGGPAGSVMPKQALLAEFGLSILATSEAAGSTRRVLVDFGYSPEAMRTNMALMGIEGGALDAAVLSHGHLDHYGGFAAIRDAAASRRIPLYVGGEEAFCERLALIGSPALVMGALDREALSRAGFHVRITAEPSVVADHAFTTGLIPLQSFERAAIPTQMRPGKGCAQAQLAPAKREAEQLADDGEHELATAYSVKGLGLVVIASCSHRGVLNSIRRAQTVSGVAKVHAVVGGFHLVRPRTEDEARRTVAELAEIDPTYVVPMHCTGETFIAEAMRVMPEKVVRTYVGNRLTFAA